MATGEDRDPVRTKVWNKLRTEVRYLQQMSNCDLCRGPRAYRCHSATSLMRNSIVSISTESPEQRPHTSMTLLAESTTSLNSREGLSNWYLNTTWPAPFPSFAGGQTFTKTLPSSFAFVKVKMKVSTACNGGVAPFLLSLVPFDSFPASLSLYPLIFLAILLLRRYASISTKLTPSTLDPSDETSSDTVYIESEGPVDEAIRASQRPFSATKNSTRRRRWIRCRGVSL